MTIVIVGSGVLGLSLAAHLSKSHASIVVLSANLPSAGSHSAAANLSTKGQQLARDSHFELKLLARAKYRSWLEELLKVKSGANVEQIQPELDAFFEHGIGVDLFYDSAQAERQFKRTQEDLLSREGMNEVFNPQAVRKVGDTQIAYENEMWVDGSWLLDLLMQVCMKRNVTFVNQKVTSAEHILQYFESTQSDIQNTKVFFCAGAWSLEICDRLNLNLPKIYRGSPRLTIGATLKLRDFGFLNVKNQLARSKSMLVDTADRHIALVELISEFGEKMTLSGNAANTFVSSLSEKISRTLIADTSLNRFKESHFYEKIMEITGKWISWETVDNPFKHVTLSQGYRLGFGHSEILCQHLETNGPLNSLKPVILSGAHKSGFLFAAVVEEMLHRHHIVT